VRARAGLAVCAVLGRCVLRVEWVLTLCVGGWLRDRDVPPSSIEAAALPLLLRGANVDATSLNIVGCSTVAAIAALAAVDFSDSSVQVLIVGKTDVHLAAIKAKITAAAEAAKKKVPPRTLLPLHYAVLRTLGCHSTIYARPSRTSPQRTRQTDTVTRLRPHPSSCQVSFAAPNAPQGHILIAPAEAVAGLERIPALKLVIVCELHAICTLPNSSSVVAVPPPTDPSCAPELFLPVCVARREWAAPRRHAHAYPHPVISFVGAPLR